LAHVDAGKTTLTERLLYAAGVIDAVGSVDAGTTRTDTLALERQRGITIKSSVVSFDLAGVTVNLIDTPGHPDFIAEVERILSLLDGAVLVISAVEGVQPQTRILMRALWRMRVPTLMFVNKIDRGGADAERTMAGIAARLTDRIIAMGKVEMPGTRAARATLYGSNDTAWRTTLTEVLADGDDALLAAYLEDGAAVPVQRLDRELAAQTRRSLLHPVFFGSASTGAGVPQLMARLIDLLAAGPGDAEAPVSGRIFKIERGPAGEKVAYVRMFAGTVHVRQRLLVETDAARRAEAKATAISVSDNGTWVRRTEIGPGEIGKLWGLGDVRIDDIIGEPPPTAVQHRFAPPTMSSVVDAVRPSDDGALRAALARLAEQDPLINVRVDDTGREISVSLFGEVQREVIEATLAAEFGLAVTFRPTTIICIERPVHAGEALEILNTDSNPFHATIGLRIEPGPHDSGIDFRMEADPQSMPMYVYKNANTFTEFMGQYIRQTLREGRFGWQVTDCIVTMTHCGYSLADGPPSKRGPLSTPADFRNLTPMVLMSALERAGTVVCEPTLSVSLETPVWAISTVLTTLGRLGAAVLNQSVRGDLTTVETVVPAARIQDLQRELPGLTAGEGVLESTFYAYRPTQGEPRTRSRTSADPRQRASYLTSLTRQGRRG
jgi:ribosomal protection tetracycline resistance protein